MRLVSRIVGMLVLASLIAIGARAEELELDHLIGMTKAQIEQCASWPGHVDKQEPLEIMTFAARDADPQQGFHPRAGTKLRYCTARLTLHDGIVERIELSSRSRGMMLSGDRCAYAFERCAR